MENKKKSRMSVNKKVELVLELLRGEPIDELCRKYDVSAVQIQQWHDIFIERGRDGFRKSPDDKRLQRAEKLIGQQALELAMFKKKMEILQKIKGS